MTSVPLTHFSSAKLKYSPHKVYLNIKKGGAGMEYEHCTPRCMAAKLLVLGIIIILVRKFTSWDIWIVIGALLVVKALVMCAMPACCQKKAGKKK